MAALATATQAKSKSALADLPPVAVREDDLPLVATRSRAEIEIHRQAAEGLHHVDDHDDLRYSPGLPGGFPDKIYENGVEVEIAPYWINLSDFAGHRMKSLLTPLTYNWTRTIPELSDMPRSAFNAEGYHQSGDQVLCVMPRKTYDKFNRDNPGTCAITLKELNKRAKVQRHGEHTSTMSEEVIEKGDGDWAVTGTMESETKTVGRLSDKQIADVMSKATQ